MSVVQTSNTVEAVKLSPAAKYPWWRAVALGALLLLARGSPSPRQEFVAAIVRPEIDEADENIGQIGLRLDTVQFTGLCRLPNYAEQAGFPRDSP